MDTNGTGRLEIIRGCMFSGKTALLIDRLLAARLTDLSVIAFKHRLDARYGPDRLRTHDGRSFDAISVSDAAEILQRTADARVVGVDEAQFFGPPLIHVCRRLFDEGRRVIVAGIDHDVWGRAFPPLPRLAELATEDCVLHTPCRACGRPARYSQRMTPIVGGDFVGGPEAYEPRCERCFVPLRRTTS